MFEAFFFKEIKQLEMNRVQEIEGQAFFFLKIINR